MDTEEERLSDTEEERLSDTEEERLSGLQQPREHTTAEGANNAAVG